MKGTWYCKIDCCVGEHPGLHGIPHEQDKASPRNVVLGVLAIIGQTPKQVTFVAHKGEAVPEPRTRRRPIFGCLCFQSLPFPPACLQNQGSVINSRVSWVVCHIRRGCWGWEGSGSDVSSAREKGGAARVFCVISQAELGHVTLGPAGTQLCRGHWEPGREQGWKPGSPLKRHPLQPPSSQP